MAVSYTHLILSDHVRSLGRYVTLQRQPPGRIAGHIAGNLESRFPRALPDVYKRQGIDGMSDTIYQAGLFIGFLVEHAGEVSINLIHIRPVLNLSLIHI